MTTLEILKAARAKISDPENWCQGKFRDRWGRLCAVGAIYKAASECGSAHHARWALRCAIGGSVATYNDTHTHAEVLAAFDRAIAAEEASA